MPFEPGQSGNPGGRNKNDKLVREAMHLAAKDKTPEGKKKLRAICEKLVDKAIEGDTQAAGIVFDRLEGKAPQALQLGGDADNPVMHKVLWEHVQSSDGTPEDPS